MTVKSKYETRGSTWRDRIEAMRNDICTSEGGYLYFKIVLNLNDAYDNNDYERHQILEDMLNSFKLQGGQVKNPSTLLSFLDKLEKYEV